MSKRNRLLLIHALSPVHCGTGQAVSGIDLPIARERPTGIPLIPGSGIKGVFRSTGPNGANGEKDPLHVAVFGPETENASDHAGSVQFSDATLLFLPVRSLRGTFAWVTSPALLRRFARDAAEIGVKVADLPENPPDMTYALVLDNRLKVGVDRVVFEDLDFKCVDDQSSIKSFRNICDKVAQWVFGSGVDTLADRDHFLERVCMVNDDIMALLLETCTEIRTRIRIDNDVKTVQDGALWTEEALPVESILVGLMMATPVKQRNGEAPVPKRLLDYVAGLVDGQTLQFGANATVGYGLCKMTVVEV